MKKLQLLLACNAAKIHSAGECQAPTRSANNITTNLKVAGRGIPLQLTENASIFLTPKTEEI